MDETTIARHDIEGAREADTDLGLEVASSLEVESLPGVRRFPDHFISEATAAVLLLCVYTVLCIFAPATLGVRANPAITPFGSKPEWYLLFLDQSLRFVPPVLGALAPVILLALLASLPFLDRNPERAFRKRIFALALLGVVVVGVVALTVMGALR
jgi:quinol-cytochrome oxidoreductase complex cytochrome b subunit